MEWVINGTQRPDHVCLVEGAAATWGCPGKLQFLGYLRLPVRWFCSAFQQTTNPQAALSKQATCTGRPNTLPHSLSSLLTLAFSFLRKEYSRISGVVGDSDARAT
jgi:hypothetical protein